MSVPILQWKEMSNVPNKSNRNWHDHSPPSPLLALTAYMISTIVLPTTLSFTVIWYPLIKAHAKIRRPYLKFFPCFHVSKTLLEFINYPKSYIAWSCNTSWYIDLILWLQPNYITCIFLIEYIACILLFIYPEV